MKIKYRKDFKNEIIECECETHKCQFSYYIYGQDVYGNLTVTLMFPNGIIDGVCLRKQMIGSDK